MESKKVRLPGVKNKSSAPIQITAEQFLREAREIQSELDLRTPKRKIIDSAELDDYRYEKRKEFENLIRRGGNRIIAVWIKFAQWEESQNDLDRARSVWERALAAVNFANHSLWIRYAEAEMKRKSIDHARNILDRAVTILPRVDQIWYKYIHMEEMLGNAAGARQIFQRWMPWMSDLQSWLSYINFELRYKEINRARNIYELFVQFHPSIEAWMKYVQFEMKNREIDLARKVYERAVEKLDPEDESIEKLYVAFAEFEEQCKEIESARLIYRFALDQLGPKLSSELQSKYLAFEKQYGDKEGIEDVILRRKRYEYEDEVRKNPLSYDAWFDYIRLEETVGNNNKERIRELYERAIANVPPAEEKSYWHRYIYLWLNYAIYEEVEAEDVGRAREVYKECLKLVPHRKFSFAKVWIMAAEFEIRQLNLKSARQILGNAIGFAPKDKIFNKYIEIELQLGNVERARKLYSKYLEWAPEKCCAWTKLAELETSLRETEVARAIFELGVDQPVLDTPEVLWKAYIDFENCEGEIGRARTLIQRLNKRKRLTSDDDEDRYEQEAQKPNLMILEAAYRWKKQKQLVCSR